MKYLNIILLISILFCNLFSQAVWIDSSTYSQGEPHIAVNPVNPNNLVDTLSPVLSQNRIP